MWIDMSAIAIATGIGLCVMAILLNDKQVLLDRERGSQHAWEDGA